MTRDLSALKNMDDTAFVKAVEPDLHELEDIRLVKLAQYKRRKHIGTIIACIGVPFTALIDYMLLFGGWLVSSSSDDSAAGLTIAFLAALWWWVSGPKRQYARNYKKTILPKIAQTLGNLTYNPNGKLIINDYRKTKIVPNYDYAKFEDHFAGEYKGTHIELSEIELEDERGSGKHRRRVTTFKGLVFLIDVPKTFFGHTILKPNQGSVFEWLNEKTLGLERADLVSPEFEKIYDAYTNDQVEARYLIHPVMIEKFTALSREYDGQGRVLAAYFEGKLLLMLPTQKNHFEPADIHIAATNIESLLEMKRELTAVLSIVDQLELIDFSHIARAPEAKSSDAAA